MRRELSLGTKFFAGPHQSDSKNLFPESIGDNSSSERVVFMDQPFRHGHSIGHRFRTRPAKDGGHVSSYFIAKVKEVPSVLNASASSFVARQFAIDGNGVWLDLGK